MEGFSRLVCGVLDDSSEAAQVLSHLRTSLHTFSDKAKLFLEDEGDQDLLLFGPFSARVIMENSAAALLGRIDPFRIVYLSRFQAQSNYDATKRAKSAFGWQGDVISIEKDKAHLWTEELELTKISRALFSQHIEHIFWRPATEAAIDFIAGLTATPVLADMLQIDSESFITGAKGRGNALYSQLSKGAHWEFFSNSSSAFDANTVRQAIRDTFVWVCRLGIISHFVPNAHGCLSASEAVRMYSETLDAINAY